jgi:hypothetical protein
MIQEFDASNEVHVLWLKRVIDAPTDKKLSTLIENPMNANVPPFDMVQILFGLSMKYTQAVFKHKAFIPEQSSRMFH